MGQMSFSFGHIIFDASQFTEEKISFQSSLHNSPAVPMHGGNQRSHAIGRLAHNRRMHLNSSRMKARRNNREWLALPRGRQQRGNHEHQDNRDNYCFGTRQLTGTRADRKLRGWQLASGWTRGKQDHDRRLHGRQHHRRARYGDEKSAGQLPNDGYGHRFKRSVQLRERWSWHQQQ